MKKKLSPRLKRIIGLAVALVLILIITNPACIWFLPDSTRNTLSEVWTRLFGNVEAITSAVTINWISIFQIIVIVLLMILLTNVVRLILEKVTPKSKKVQSVFSMINSFISYAAALVGLIWCLSAIGINLSTIFASLGIVALVIGFAAESLIADIITGLFLVFEDDFNVGDIIEYNDFRGEVISIGIRVTCIRNSAGNVRIINNSDIRDVLNRSMGSTRAVCDIPVSYSANLEATEKVLNNILASIPKNNPGIFKEPPVYIGVQELGSSSVNLRICAEVEEKNVFSATRIMNREIKIGFDKAGIEIPFQQVVIHQAED